MPRKLVKDYFRACIQVRFQRNWHVNQWTEWGRYTLHLHGHHPINLRPRENKKNSVLSLLVLRHKSHHLPLDLRTPAFTLHVLHQCFMSSVSEWDFYHQFPWFWGFRTWSKPAINIPKSLACRLLVMGFLKPPQLHKLILLINFLSSIYQIISLSILLVSLENPDKHISLTKQ
jgi:hypothetical protein